MKSALRIILIAVVVVIIVVVFAMIVRNNSIVPPIDNSDNSSGDKIVEFVTYDDIESLATEYDLEQAKSDKCFAIDASGKIYNKDILDAFMSNVEKKSNANLRVAQVNSEGKLLITDLKYSGDALIAVEDATRIGAEINTNTYDLSSEYSIHCESNLLEDGTELEIYSLVPKSGEISESIVLFGYVKNTVSYEETLPNKFEATVKSIEESMVCVIPLDTMVEKSISDEIYLDISSLNLSLEEGQNVQIAYEDGINERDGKYQIENILSIDIL